MSKVSILGYIILGMGGLVFFAGMVYAVPVMFMMHETQDGWRDGLGRPLSAAPPIMRIILRHNHLWAGPWWMVFDASVMLLAVGALWLSVTLAEGCVRR